MLLILLLIIPLIGTILVSTNSSVVSGSSYSLALPQSLGLASGQSAEANTDHVKENNKNRDLSIKKNRFINIYNKFICIYNSFPFI